MDITANSICYQAVQRTFRNAIVNFLRKSMRSAFPTDHIMKLKKPFKAEWDQLEAAAARSRESGGTLTSVKDEFDLLSVSHFYSLFDSYLTEIAKSSYFASIEIPAPNRPKLLGALKSIKDFRDPLSHPVDEEVSFEEAVGALSNVRQVLLALGLSLDASHVAELLRGLDADIYDPAEMPICVLPTQDSIYVDFVGRQKVLEDLSTLFNDEFSKRCLLAGDGGKGKSAVAYRYAQKIASRDSRFKMVVWVSAKMRRFEAGETVEMERQDFHDAESAVNTLLSQYGPVEKEKPYRERKALLLDLLNEYPTFIVADDIDTVLEDVDAVALFTFEIPTTASRVLLTSRRDIPGVKSLGIAGFSVPEAELFIHSRIQQYGLSFDAYPAGIIRNIREACDGSPLYIDDLMRLTRIVAPSVAVAKWREKQGDEARKYALEREFENLTPDAKSVLISAVVSEHPPSFAEIQSVLNFSEDRLISALKELHTLFLLPEPSLVEGEQRYHLNANTKRLILIVEGNSDFFKRTERKSKALSGSLPDVRHDVIGQLIRQALLLSKNGKFTEGETLLLRAIDAYPNAADLHGFLGYLYSFNDRITDARASFEHAGKLKSKNVETYARWVKMEMATAEYTSAARAAEIGLGFVPKSYRLFLLKIEAKFRLASDFHARLQTEKAERIWRDLVEDIDRTLKPHATLSMDEQDINPTLLKRLTICHDHLGDMGELNKRFTQWRKEHPSDPSIPVQRAIFAKRRGTLFKG